jgi:DNA-binding response OmpR family regulator
LPPVPSLTIHRRRGAVWTHGVRRALTTRQFDLLVYLIGLGGAVATREDVLGAVWREDRPPEGTRTVDMHIARIREKLDLASVIVTVRGQGYRFNTSIALDETSGL